MLLPTLIKSKMATMFSAAVTVLQRRHHPQNIPHISCREDQRLPTEGKVISKYCNISKINGRSSINPHAPCTTVGIWLCVYVVQKHYGKSHWASTMQFHKKKRDHMQYILGGANITLETQTANCYCPFFLLWLFHPVIQSNDHVCR